MMASTYFRRMVNGSWLEPYFQNFQKAKQIKVSDSYFHYYIFSVISFNVHVTCFVALYKKEFSVHYNKYQSFYHDEENILLSGHTVTQQRYVSVRNLFIILSTDAYDQVILSSIIPVVERVRKIFMFHHLWFYVQLVNAIKHTIF